MFKHIFLLLLLLSACAVSAARFGSVTVEELPELSRYSPLWHFRAVNHGSENAEITFIVREELRLTFAAEKTIVLPPRGSQEVAIPVGFGNSFYGSISIFLKIDGKPYDSSISRSLSYSHFYGPKNVLFSAEVDKNSLLANFFFNRVVRGGTYSDTVLAAAQWRPDLREYINFRMIVLESENMPHADTMKVLAQYMATGGLVIVHVAEKAPWPGGEPGEKAGFYHRKSGLGDFVIIREIKNKAAEKYIKACQRSMKERRWSPKEIKIPKELDVLNKLEELTIRNVSSHMNFRMEYPKPKVPVGAMVLVMAAFITLIGPVNYLILRKRRQEILLLVTVPAISFAFCLLVILYITFSEGWYSRGKGVGATVLDQTTGEAVTSCAMSYYSPLPVRGGFRFDSDEIVSFVDADRVAVNLDRGQVFSSGLLRPRIPVNIKLDSVRKISEKLRVTVLSKNAIEVVNGLGAPVKKLTVSAPDGTVFVYAERIQPGEKVTLTGKKSKSYPYELSARQINESSVPPPGYYRAEIPQALFYSAGIRADEFNATHTVIGKY